MKRIVLIIPMLFVTPAMAGDDSLVIDAGMGAFSTAGNTPPDVKFAKFGWQEDLWYSFKQRINAGLWLDQRSGGKSSSAFTGYQVGFDVQNDVFEMSIFVGPTLISSPDTDLGGIFQMNDSGYFGIKDRDGNSIGVSLNHFSSGGIEKPNIGKNFGCLEIKFPF